MSIDKMSRSKYNRKNPDVVVPKEIKKLIDKNVVPSAIESIGRLYQLLAVLVLQLGYYNFSLYLVQHFYQ